MEQIITLIIIGAVGAIFNKLAKKQKSNEQEKQSPVSTTTVRDMMKRRIETVMSEVKQSPKMKKNIQEARIETNFDSDKHLEKLKKQEEMYVKKIEASKNLVTNMKSKKSVGLLSDESDIVKGIILSEVLGPPRAKKPYRR